MEHSIEIRNSIHPDHGKSLDTDGLRKEFLITGLFEEGKVALVYSHIDRIIAGGAVPKAGKLSLAVGKETIGADYLLERRELGVLNLGGAGTVTVDGKAHPMTRLDGLYVGKGSKSVELSSASPKSPAKFYLLSTMAHKELPTTLIGVQKARRVEMGSREECNVRTIHQVIHPEVVESCSLVMGYTHLEEGSAWNTMPCHTHVRRMEVYLYFDLAKDTIVFHLMGQPSETRHIVVRNEEAVICPSWSIHSGVGTKNYSFVWGMTGENQTFTDMDDVSMDALR